ncbi:MAG: sodium:proton antiporter [Planctomycetes bacterium]|nr:sodium:proton antiporter [Planctomycetota bacterium]
MSTLATLSSVASGGSFAASEGSLGATLGLWTVVPFALLLLAIAVLPLFAGHWWEHNKNRAKVAATCALPIAAYMLFAHGAEGGHNLLEKLEEYVSFLALLASLFVISGGIYIRGSFSGTPLVNSCLLGLGAVLANLIGTTGASMLLIRPFLRANASRKRKVHLVVFFIFTVSNCGGLLTPLGDPPLFLGFLKGVPFEWTLRLWKEWLLVNALLLFLFNVWDQIVLNKEELERKGSQLEAVQHHAKFGIDGKHNIVFLLAIVGVIIASGSGLGNGGKPWHFGVQELAMLGLAGWSYAMTKSHVRHENRFTFAPIIEVAVLFAGIFVTMGPALLILNAWSQGERLIFGHGFALSEPWQFFWASGLLSSFLDNAPTYLAFSATAAGLEHVPLEGAFLGNLLAKGGASEMLLVAISCGSVFMGANTYIGNGPNFMVKAIAEENGVRMPSFFGYMAYSIAILIPIFVVVTLVFFR